MSRLLPDALGRSGTRGKEGIRAVRRTARRFCKVPPTSRFLSLRSVTLRGWQIRKLRLREARQLVQGHGNQGGCLRVPPALSFPGGPLGVYGGKGSGVEEEEVGEREARELWSRDLGGAESSGAP